MSESASNISEDVVREAIRCKPCGLVQYRTRTGNCRRCLKPLPSRLQLCIPREGLHEISRDSSSLCARPTNFEAVEKIGRRIQQLRKLHGLTQNQLRKRSRVSRSYLARVERGLLTPSLGTVEKISKALGVGLNNFFVPDASREALLEDPFIYGLQPFLRRLNFEQWQSVLQRLAAINS